MEFKFQWVPKKIHDRFLSAYESASESSGHIMVEEGRKRQRHGGEGPRVSESILMDVNNLKIIVLSLFTTKLNLEIIILVVYIYIYIYIHICMYIYIYMYI